MALYQPGEQLLWAYWSGRFFFVCEINIEDVLYPTEMKIPKFEIVIERNQFLNGIL